MTNNLVSDLNKIEVVIGSWGSYNACNEKALGSKWLTLNDYDSWEEIAKKLEKENFKLNGIDEELFIQDISSNLDFKSMNCDYMHPERLFNILKTSEVLDDIYKYEVLEAYLEVRTFSEFEELVEKHQDDWTDYVILMENTTWEELGQQYVEEYGYKIPKELSWYIDYENYAKDTFDRVEEYSKGLIEIL